MRKRQKSKNNWNGRFIRGLVIALVCVGVVWFSSKGIITYLRHASFFQVKKVTFIGLDEEGIAQLISKQFLHDNILTLDSAAVAKNLKRTHSQFYDVDIVKRLPDELMVRVVRRKPVAQIQQKGYFLVDSEGVIVSDASNRAFGGYVIIGGIKGISSELSFGKKISSTELFSGLQLAELIMGQKERIDTLLPSDLKNVLMRVDVALHPSLYLYIDSLELRFHSDSMYAQLNSLINILPSLDKKIKKVKYIDLRFGDPAVSF